VSNHAIEPQAFNFEDAVRFLGTTRRSLYRAITEGHGPRRFYEGRRPRFLRRDLVEWLEDLARQNAAVAKLPAAEAPHAQ
jgi:predicted DNA-binding transcriptional regulator AlpA